MSYQQLSVLAANPNGERGSAAKLAYHAQTNQLLYPRGRTLILRSLGTPPPTLSGPIKFAQPHTSTYVEHAHPITAVSISPTGYYAATGDAQGTVRVWDLVAGDKVLKLEQKALSGTVKDIAWDAESKRLIAVGDGRESFGSSFLLDSGSSVGTIEGHSKPINAVATNSSRPYRALTVSDDAQVGWYTGVPYKLAHTLRPFNKFVHAAAFSPSGKYAAAAGSDGVVVLLDGKTGAEVGRFGEGIVQGTIYALQFVPGNDDTLAVAGADGKVHLFGLTGSETDVKAEVLASVDLGSGSSQGGDQLVALVCTSPTSLVVQSVRGVLTQLQFSSFTESPTLEVLLGPTKGITDLAVQGTIDEQNVRLSAGSYDGRVYTWDLGKGLDFRTGGAPPVAAVAFDKGASGTASAAVVGLASKQGQLVGATLDDQVHTFDPATHVPTHQAKSNALQLPSESAPQALGGQPRTHGVTIDGRGVTYVVTTAGVDILGSSPLPMEGATAVSAYATGSTQAIVAVGQDDHKIQLFYHGSDQPTALGTLTSNRSAITVVSFSPDGKLLAVGESSGKILVYDTASLTLSTSLDAAKSATASVEPKIVHWVFHTARVESIGWSKDSAYAVSGSLDTHVYVWSVAKPMKRLAIKDAHAGGVSATVFLDQTTIATAGADGVTNVYALTALPGQE